MAQGRGEQPRAPQHTSPPARVPASPVLGVTRTPQRLLQRHRFIYNKELENQWENSAFLQGWVSSTRLGRAARSHPTYPHTSGARQNSLLWSCLSPCPPLVPVSPWSCGPLSHRVTGMLSALVPLVPLTLWCHWDAQCHGPTCSPYPLLLRPVGTHGCSFPLSTCPHVPWGH